MTYFDETMPTDSTEHDTENPVEETAQLLSIDTETDSPTVDALIEEVIESAEEFALENEERLLQEGEGEGDFETESEKKEKNKKKRRKSKSEQQLPDEPLPERTEPDDSDEEPDIPEDFSEEVDSNEDESLIQQRDETSKARFYMDKDGKYVEDASSPYRESYQRLSSAFNRRDLLSGYVEGFERNSINIPRVFMYCGDIKVIIPLTHLDLPLTEEELNDPLEARMAVNAILGAKIYYMILDINFPAKVAVASRTYANRRRRNANVNHIYRNGEYKLKQGVLCTAQVIHVGDKFARIDIYGFQTTIGIGEISNLWVNDVREVLDVGSEIMVEVVNIVRDPETGDATAIDVSMRLAEHTNEVKIEQDMTYTGIINGFSSAAYFVRVSGVEKEVRCPISKCHTGKLIEVGDYVKFYVDHFRNSEPSGSILKILKKTDETMQYY